MSPPTEPIIPYEVVYSQLVKSEFVQLYTKLKGIGLGPKLIQAAKQLEAQLRLYPQFGQPLQDLATEGETIWIGFVDPIVVRYVIDESKRIVFVVVPFKALLKSKP